MIVHRTFGLEVLQLILASKLSELEHLENFSANNHLESKANANGILLGVSFLEFCPRMLPFARKIKFP